MGRWRDDFNFNPRSREGSDAYYLIDARCRPDFNPRSREGSDGFARVAFARYA